MLKKTIYDDIQVSLAAAKELSAYPYREWNFCSDDENNEKTILIDNDFGQYALATNSVWLSLDPIGGGITRSIIGGFCANTVGGKAIACGIFPNLLGVFLNLVPLGLVIDNLVQAKIYVAYKKARSSLVERYCNHILINDESFGLYKCNSLEIETPINQGYCYLLGYQESLSMNTTITSSREVPDDFTNYALRGSPEYPFDEGKWFFHSYRELQPNTVLIKYSKSFNVPYEVYARHGLALKQCIDTIGALLVRARISNTIDSVEMNQIFGKNFAMTCSSKTNLSTTLFSSSTKETLITAKQEKMKLIKYQITNPTTDHINADRITDTQTCTPEAPCLTYSSFESIARPALYDPSLQECNPNTNTICGDILIFLME
jgi:hypothetical protein